MSIETNVVDWQNWNKNQVFIYPPVIDKTVSAFSVNSESLNLYLYFQNSDFDVDTETVIVSITNKGNSILKNKKYDFYSLVQENPEYSTDTDKTMYRISIKADELINEDFAKYLGSQLQIKIAVRRKNAKIFDFTSNVFAIVKYNQEETADTFVNTYNNNNLIMSSFSDSIPFYIILPPRFSMYGGLSATDIIDGASFPKQISTGETNEQNHILYAPGEGVNIFYPETPDAYRIKGQLTFDSTYIDQSNEEQFYQEGYSEDDYLVWYQIQFYKENAEESKLIEDSTRLYPDRNWDFFYRSFAYSFKTDFSSEISVSNDENDYNRVLLLVVYKTAKGYMASKEFSMRVQKGVNESLITRDSDLEFQNGSLEISLKPSHGIINLKGKIINKKAKTILGYLVFQRADMRKINIQWETIAKTDFEVRLLGTSSFIFDDKTAEPGIPYKYRVAFYYKDQDLITHQWSIKYAKNELVQTNLEKNYFLMTEDSFLISKADTFKIGYNPQVSNLKRNIIDIVTPTLGGAYPFVRRNGQQKYHTFTIGGLISCSQENNDLPFESALKDDTIIFNKDWISSYNQNLEISLYDKQKINEKLYRQKIIDFLHKDQVVLFKSFQEGNMLIKLSNIQLTPQQGTNRVLYSFTATATEIAEPIASSYEKYFSDITEDITLSIVRYYIYGDWDSAETYLNGYQLNIPFGRWYDSIPENKEAEKDATPTVSHLTTSLIYKYADIIQIDLKKDDAYFYSKSGEKKETVQPGFYPDLSDNAANKEALTQELIYDNSIALLGEKKIYRINLGDII